MAPLSSLDSRDATESCRSCIRRRTFCAESSFATQSALHSTFSPIVSAAAPMSTAPAFRALQGKEASTVRLASVLIASYAGLCHVHKSGDVLASTKAVHTHVGSGHDRDMLQSQGRGSCIPKFGQRRNSPILPTRRKQGPSPQRRQRQLCCRHLATAAVPAARAAASIAERRSKPRTTGRCWGGGTGSVGAPSGSSALARHSGAACEGPVLQDDARPRSNGRMHA
jgi:hypothetical protein